MVSAVSTFLSSQNASVDICNHNVGIRNHRVGIRNNGVGTLDHCAGIRDHHVSIDCKLSLKRTVEFADVQRDQLNIH